MTRLPCAPLIHGAAQWATLPSLFAGEKVVLLPQFDAARGVEGRRAAQGQGHDDRRRRDGASAARGAPRGRLRRSSIVAFSSHAALFSPSVKEQFLEALPNAVLTDAIGSSESGFQGIGLIMKGTKVESSLPRVNSGPKTIVINDDNQKVAAG